MLAFMGAQSFIMMYQAGEGWQYGKRKQSAMSNEDFNKQTPLSIMQNQAFVLRSARGTIEKSMNDMTPMISTIVSQYGDFVKEIIKVLGPVSQDVVKTVIESIPKGGFPGAGDKAIVEFFKNLIPKIEEAHAQVPSGGTLTTDVSQFDSKIDETPKLVLPPAGSRTYGYLGGPAPKVSVGQRFREFEKTRNPDKKILAEMLKNLVAIKLQLKISQRSAPNRQSLPALVRKIKGLMSAVTSLERRIVFQRIKIARK